MTATPLSPRFTGAFDLAREIHGAQTRKSSHAPYLSHLLAVTALVLEAGGDEDVAIAALLHDAAEDQGGETTLAEIGDRFGRRVAAIVRACSDDLPDDPSVKRPWWERKTAYLDHLGTADRDVALVAAADKLHNLRSTVDDYRRNGEAMWNRFNDSSTDGGRLTKRQAQLWYYRRVADVLGRRLTEEPAAFLVDDIDRALAELLDLVASANDCSVADLHAEIDACG